MYAVQNDTGIKFNIVLYIKVIFVGQGVGIQKVHNRETLKFNTELYIKPALLVRSNVWSTNMLPGLRANECGYRHIFFWKGHVTKFLWEPS